MDILKPIFFNPQKENMEDFQKRHGVLSVIDKYKDLLEELFLIRNPKYRFDKNYQADFARFLKEHTGGNPLIKAGNWFYFPWNKTLVHYLPEKMHQELRTARNKNLITEEEQEKFYNLSVGIVGLSIGSHIALTIAMMGGARRLKLADPDNISGSNLNRIRADFTQVGVNKAIYTARLIYQIDPYAEVYAYTEGVEEHTIDGFLDSPRIDALIEETDNLELKIQLRLAARLRRLPVIMATDNGDNIIVDIERYDLHDNLQLFNGLLGNVTIDKFQNLDPKELPRLAAKIAGPDLATPRMKRSVSEVGKTLYSWPQLGNAATLSGAVVACIVRRLANNLGLQEGKFEVNLDAVLDPEYHSQHSIKFRKDETKKFLKAVNII
jgi:hypothetical protein